jgi:NAD(P)-dependent dehydrogenase (short-subunit alcohol dehydrogenase family)
MVPNNSSYASAKVGVLGFTRTSALDGGRFGIQVNAVAPRAKTRMSTPDILSHTYDAPAEMFEGSMEQFAPELVSGGGHVMRLALLETQGLTDDHLTPEKVAENIDKILDLTGAQVMTVGVLLNGEF